MKRKWYKMFFRRWVETRQGFFHQLKRPEYVNNFWHELDFGSFSFFWLQNDTHKNLKSRNQ